MKNLTASLIAGLALLSLALTPAIAEESFVEGVDYALVEPAQNTESGDKIEVLEIFWYGCPHCFDFEPFVHDWVEKKPDDVAFRRMPAIFRNSWAVHARTYYAAEALGVTEQVHSALFRAIHVDRKKLFDEESIIAFIGENGVNTDDFTAAYSGMTVMGKARKAATLSRSYGIRGVPAVIINGKYRTSGRMAGSYDRLLKLVDYLVAKERQGQAE